MHGTPYLDKSIAVVRPVGPPPAIATETDTELSPEAAAEASAAAAAEEKSASGAGEIDGVAPATHPKPHWTGGSLRLRVSIIRILSSTKNLKG